MSEAPREGTPAAALIHALTLSKGEPITETRVAELTRLRVAAVSQSMFDAVVGGWLTRRRNLAGSIVYGPGPKLCEQLGIAPPAPPPAPAPAPVAKPTTIEQAGDVLLKAQAAAKAAKAEALGVRASNGAKASPPMSQVGLAPAAAPTQRKLAETVSLATLAKFRSALAGQLTTFDVRASDLVDAMHGPLLTTEDWVTICEHAPALADGIARSMEFAHAGALRDAVAAGVRLSMSTVISRACTVPPEGPSVAVRDLIEPFVSEAVLKPNFAVTTGHADFLTTDRRFAPVEVTPGTGTPAAHSLVKPSPKGEPLAKPAAKKPRRAGPPLPELDVDAIQVIRMGPVDGRQSPKDGKWQALFDKLCAEPFKGSEGFPTMELPAAYAKTLQSFGYKLMKAKPDGPKFKISELGSKCILQRVG